MKRKVPIIVGSVLFVILIVCGVVFYLYQYTEVFGKKVIPAKVESIQIQYVPGIDFKTIQKLNEKEEVVKVEKVSLSKEEIKSIKKHLSRVRESSIKKQSIDVESYQLVINDKIILHIGDEFGIVENGKKTTNVSISNEVIETIQNITNKNNKKILKKIETENIIVKLEGSSITLKDKDNLKNVQESLTYYPISLKEDYKNYQDGYKIEMILDNNTKVYLYESSIGCIVQKNNEETTNTYAIFTNGTYDLIQNIYKISIES